MCVCTRAWSMGRRMGSVQAHVYLDISKIQGLEAKGTALWRSI